VNVTVLIVVEISFIKNVSFVTELVESAVEIVALTSTPCLTLRPKPGLGLVTTSVVTVVRSVYDVETSVVNWVSVGDGCSDMSVAKSKLINCE
jgi:hypothetical protein